jgi:hypothetical protein
MLRQPVPAKRTRLGALLVVAVVAALTLGPAPGAVADTRPTLAPDELLSVASQAAGWLAGTQLTRDGSVADGLGRPDPLSTAWTVLAMRAAGLVSEADAPTRWLEQNVKTLARDSQGDSVTGLALAILVAHTQGLPIETFGGQDLLARLTALRNPDGHYGPATSAYGAYDPFGDIGIRQSLVLSALGAAGRTDAGAADWLERRECPDGGWALQQGDGTGPCTASPHTTGFALQGLSAIGREVPRRALRALSRLQRPDGGFGQLYPDSDALATAAALQGLIAAGVDPNTDRWRKGTGGDAATPFTAILRFSMNQSGGFSLLKSGAPDAGVTAQVTIAAAGQRLPLLAAGPQPDPVGDTAGSASAEPSGDGTSVGSASTTGSDGFSSGLLLSAGAVALAAIGGYSLGRRRRPSD